MKDSTMVGVGITPEGINQNYVMYEFALERGWQSEPLNASEWFDHYAFARYGESDEFIQDAWQHLRVNILMNSYLPSLIAIFNALIAL